MWCLSVKKSDTIKFLPRKDLFRVDEVADIFGVHHRTVRKWIDEGVLENIVRTPSGRNLRILRTELLRIIDESSYENLSS